MHDERIIQREPFDLRLVASLFHQGFVTLLPLRQLARWRAHQNDVLEGGQIILRYAFYERRGSNQGNGFRVDHAVSHGIFHESFKERAGNRSDFQNAEDGDVKLRPPP